MNAAIRSKKETPRNFPGGPVVKTLSFQYRDMGSIPGLEIKILHATHSSKKKKKKKE